MSQDGLQEKLDQASRYYNEGRYDEAMAVWKGVLQEEPENERAREGLQMVELLTQDFSALPAADAPAGAAPAAVDAAQVQEAVQRVQELLDSGDAEAAREGVEVLLQIAPEDPAVLQCAARLETGGDPGAYVAEQLSLARHYVMMEEPAAAMEACRRVLSVDGDNDEAKELLQQARGGEDPPMPSAPGPPPAAGAPEGSAPVVDQPLGDDDLLTFDLDSLEDAGDPMEASPSLEIDLPAAEASAEAPGDGGDAGERIAKLLTEGDEMEALGDLQGAIQIWSRVFILEDSNTEAEERVERARRALEQQAIQVDEIRFRAEDLFKAGNLAGSRDEYQKILQILPQHREARQAIQQIEQKLAGGDVEEQQAAADSIEAVPLSLPEQPQEAVTEELELDESLLEPQAPPPAPAPEVVIPAAARARRGPGRGLVLSVAVVGMVVLGVGGYVGWTMMFPNGASDELQSLEPQPLDRTSVAPTGAGSVPEPAPQEPEAAEPAAAEPSPMQPVVLDDREAAVLARQAVEDGTSLFDKGEYAEALAQFRQALNLDPSNMDAKDWETRTAAEVSRWEVFEREVATIRAAVADYDYESGLKKLYRLDSPTEEGQARTHRWTVVCWYNWGVLRLQAGRLSDAEEKFQEVLALEPDDEEAASHLEVVGRYRKRAVDATFKNYTSRLTLRDLD